MKKLLASILCAVTAGALLSGSALASSARPDEYFTITEYDVRVDISEANVYSISETITVNFLEPRHGIYREIPLSGTRTRTGSDGHTITIDYTASISDINVEGYEFSTSVSGGVEEIKIGTADKTVEGAQTYKISYKLNFGNDDTQDFDEVYYNIIGTEWNSTIGHVRFSVALPDAFDTGKVGFSIGAGGTSGYNTNDLKYSITGTTVSGETLRALQPYEGITMRVELPQGYFATDGDDGPIPLREPDQIQPTLTLLLVILAAIAIPVMIVTPPV